jgi:hypothetical protein
MALLLPLPVSIFLPSGANFPAWRSTMTGGSERAAWGFDNAVSQTLRTPMIQMPVFTGALSLKLLVASSATSGNVLYRCAIESVTSLDSQNTNTSDSFDTTNSGSSESIPATTYNPKEISIALTNIDSLVAGEYVTFRVDRDVSVGSNVSAMVFLYAASIWDES